VVVNFGLSCAGSGLRGVRLLATVAFGLLKAAMLLATCIVIEHIATIERYSLKARVPGILMGATGVVGSIVLMWPINQLWNHVDPAMTIPLWQYLQPLGVAGYALQFLALILIADFLAYWRHRMEHSRWWWPVHKVHHAPRELHAANDIGHPLQALFSFVWITVPMSLFNVSGPGVPLTLALTVTFLSMYIHSPIDFHFGPLRRLIVDNRFHRIHHSLEPRHFDKNFGICFSAWDYLFGTAYEPKQEWPAVGLADVPAPRSVRDYLLLPLRQPVNGKGGSRDKVTGRWEEGRRGNSGRRSPPLAQFQNEQAAAGVGSLDDAA
jgi:sterol desaturase/sphingolipid hydroxylase (fatty acid hydroxylase superfamily)